MTRMFASVDLGGTNIACALGGADGKLVCERKTPTRSHEGPEAVLKRIGELVKEASREAGAKPVALGMGVPGLADVENGVTKFLPNLPTQWRDVNVRRALEPAVGCPVHLLNDVRMATLGELTFGHGKSVSTMVFFALGTGVGGGVVVDGKLRLGPFGAAGELGHQTVLPDGPLCGCGNRGCLETLASGPALTAEGVRLMLSGQAPKLHEATGGQASAVTPAAMATSGDAAVRTAIERYAGFLAVGAANMITALHPEVVVIGGGVGEMGELLFDPLRRAVKDRVRLIPDGSYRVEPSLLGEKAGALGGIALAMSKT